MRVFVTGATGHIGSALVPELLEVGHEVVGLARSETSATALKALGVQAHLGDLDDLDGLRDAASAADGVIHLAFKHEEMRSGNFPVAIQADLRAIQAFGEALEGSGKPLVISSGGNGLISQPGNDSGSATGRPGTEQDIATGGRADAENAVIGFAERGVRSAAVRNPIIAHSPRDHHGFVQTLIGIARAKGVSAYVGEGANRWPAVHVLDQAHLYRLALENAPAGSRLHAVGEEGIPFRLIAETIGRHLNIPTTSIPTGEVQAHFGFAARFVPLDLATSSALTRQLLGWEPVHHGLVAELDQGHYFTTE
jgi:nucleoside-diphosphate-sugar epimerase